jgi:superfamily II DNA/RNA helicase
MGFNQATPIQELAIPIILDNKDLIACAQTGTGKTAAYLLPILNKIILSKHKGVNTLILVPTRELAVQIDQQLQGFSYFINVSSTAIYGGGDGMSYEQQKKALIKGADIIIATPGRLISQLISGEINFEGLQHLVLDEADKMLDMGFYDDLIKIINRLPVNRQTLLFSATMPQKIRQLTGKILNNPEQINIAISKPAEGIEQIAYLCFDGQKNQVLELILSENKFESMIIFASTKEKVKSLQHELKKLGLRSKSFHSDLEQAEREAIMNDFKNKKLNTLIGTDILARGIDVDGIELVLNYDVPPDPEDYVHRIGRTARGTNNKGTAITFINDKDQKRFDAIEKLIEREIPKRTIPESIGTSPVYNPLAKTTFKRKPSKPNFKKKNGGTNS